ncbi:hypothetical protein V2J09_006731 [Rumex salicifolius]
MWVTVGGQAEFLPDRIWFRKILKYLPVKMLLQFRSVCKGWKQLIDSPALVQNHLCSKPYIHRPTWIWKQMRVLCCLPSTSSQPLSQTTRKTGAAYFIYLAPFTASFVSIVSANSSSGTPPSYGFWIHLATKAFKIIVVQTRPVRNCFLYSSIHGDGDWSEIPTPGKLEYCEEGLPVMIGAVAHWGGCLVKSLGLQLDNVILPFDFMQECFGFIKLPNPLEYYENTVPIFWKHTLSLLCWSDQFPSRCKIFLRREDSWIAMFDFKASSSLVHVFWAMEDSEASDRGLLVAQENTRLLATTVRDPKLLTDELILDGTRSGCRPVREGLERYINLNMAYHFVESLLFPNLSSAKNFNLD